MKSFLTVVLMLFTFACTAQSINSGELGCELSPNYVGGSDTLFAHFVKLDLTNESAISSMTITLEDDLVIENNLEIQLTGADVLQYENPDGNYEVIIGDFVNLIYDKVRIVINNSSGEADSLILTVQ